eukprot:CAMPEP_0198299246 /NCGR_PEP_ID=MMETSP1449-20131203/44005_1 /TAXON_ID=420275 /ORGANISM="Attheya septentrionalis, Strain CCMP2084" /LENGTH=300 /DNA_ID=CAMNT_0044000735 /DNA_START=45 /DNA_END=947 /DNA_ORIENTATION=+
MLMGPEEDLPTLVARKDHLNVLRFLRAHQVRDPDLTLSSAFALLGGVKLSSKGGLDEAERLAVLEQLCMSALDMQNHDVAEAALGQIRVSIPAGSVRSRRLLALCLESAGDLGAASTIYDDLIKSNPSNTIALQRKYCILKASNKPVEAKEALNDYIEGTGGGDPAAWMEMATLCLDMSDYKGAAYALEETVLASPLDATVHCRLAEVYATLGGLSNLKLARQHMAQSLELAPGARAAFGLVSVASQYLDACPPKDMDSLDAQVAKELVKYGTEQILKLYKSTPTANLIQKVLMDLQTTD